MFLSSAPFHFRLLISYHLYANYMHLIWLVSYDKDNTKTPIGMGKRWLRPPHGGGQLPQGFDCSITFLLSKVWDPNK